jgi:hypothetical protein
MVYLKALIRNLTRKTGGNTNISVKIDGDLTKVRTVYLQNTGTQRYRHTTPQHSRFGDTDGCKHSRTIGLH